MRKVKKPKPAVTIDGAKRFDRHMQAARQAAFAKLCEREPKSGHPRANRKSQIAEARRLEKLLREDGGKDGARLSSVRIKVSAYRQERNIMRCAPGTFEWQYGRNKQDMLFHAGSHLARLWEQAGIAIASSADFLRGTASGYATGISSARLANIEKLTAFVNEVGRRASDRLIAYCVQGVTSAEVARQYGIPPRDIAAVLRQDLKACAEHFQFVSKRMKS